MICLTVACLKGASGPWPELSLRMFKWAIKELWTVVSQISNHSKARIKGDNTLKSVAQAYPGICSVIYFGLGSKYLENPRDGGAWWAAIYGVHRVGHDWNDLAAAAGSVSVNPLAVPSFCVWLLMSVCPCVLLSSCPFPPIPTSIHFFFSHMYKVN